MEGWLHMKDEGGSWHQRWLVLKDGHLAYYKKRDDKMKGTFSVADALVGSTVGIDGKKDFLFALQMPGKTLYLQGRNADEVSEWTTAIKSFSSAAAVVSPSPSPRKTPSISDAPALKPTGLVRTQSQKDNLVRSQGAASPLANSLLLDAKPLPPVPVIARQDGSAASTGLITMRRNPSTGDSDIAETLQRAEMILQRVITAAGHAGAGTVGITPPGSPRDKPLPQRAKDLENAAKQCEFIVMRLLQQQQQPPPSPKSSPTSPSSSVSPVPPSPLSLASSSNSGSMILQNAVPSSTSTPAAAHSSTEGTGSQISSSADGSKIAASSDPAALKIELSAVKERSLKAIKALMEQNEHLKKKREDLLSQVEKSKMARDENTFLKSRLDMAVRKMSTKDEQIKKLRDKLEEVQPGASVPLMTTPTSGSTRELALGSAGGSNGGASGTTSPRAPGSFGSPPPAGPLSPLAAASSGTSTPTTEVEKETAEWLGTVFKFLDDPKVARYSTLVKPGSQPTSPRDNV